MTKAIETHLPLFHFQAFGPCSSISFSEAHVFLPLVLSLAIFCWNRSSTLLSSILSLSRLITIASCYCISLLQLVISVCVFLSGEPIDRSPVTSEPGTLQHHQLVVISCCLLLMWIDCCCQCLDRFCHCCCRWAPDDHSCSSSSSQHWSLSISAASVDWSLSLLSPRSGLAAAVQMGFRWSSIHYLQAIFSLAQAEVILAYNMLMPWAILCMNLVGFWVVFYMSIFGLC